MASSTTNPVDSTIPSKVRILIEKSATYITKKEPISEMGIAMIGMSVVRQLRKKKKITNTTSPKAIKTVFSTS